MNKVTLGAALVTIGVALPAGWRSLDADIQADGPRMRPKQQSFETGDATITLDLDRGIMPAGGKASVTLVASSDRPHEVAVDLRALEEMGYSGERVEQPPKLVDERTVMVDAQPGGGPPVVATFRLAAKEKRTGLHEWFTVVARDAKGGKEADAASVGLATWSGSDFAMSIEPPVQLPAAGAFSIAVRVKNTTQKPIFRPWIEVGGAVEGVTGLDSELVMSRDDYSVEEVADPAAPEEGDAPDLAPGAELVRVYRVTPAHWGVNHFVFTAQAHTEGGGRALATAAMDRPETEDDGGTGAPVAAR
jgi:hypothetical protein